MVSFSVPSISQTISISSTLSSTFSSSSTFSIAFALFFLDWRILCTEATITAKPLNVKPQYCTICNQSVPLSSVLLLSSFTSVVLYNENPLPIEPEHDDNGYMADDPVMDSIISMP